MTDLTAPQTRSQNISKAPWWLAAVQATSPFPSLLAEGTWAKPKTSAPQKKFWGHIFLLILAGSYCWCMLKWLFSLLIQLKSYTVFLMQGTSELFQQDSHSGLWSRRRQREMQLCSQRHSPSQRLSGWGKQAIHYGATLGNNGGG